MQPGKVAGIQDRGRTASRLALVRRTPSDLVRALRSIGVLRLATAQRDA